MSKLAVIAVGGNSLIKDEKRVSVEAQEEALRETAHHIADMIEAGWDLAIGHGNGPQVGFILRRSEIAAKVEGMHEVPLDVCGADSQGAIGYEFQQALQNEYYRRGIQKSAATIVTQTLVDKRDPAFQKPTKPIGSFMDEAEAKRREREMGWSVVEDAGRGWRRVVASPMPRKILELESVKLLINAGVTVITVGGGGIPVVDQGNGEYEGIAAVIDKDFASSLLAQEIGAELFLIATAVEKVQRIPAGAFRCKSNVPVQYLDMLVLRRMDRIALQLAQELERAGHPSFTLAAQETDWNLKRASYARLSTRHLGVEAGLGTLGLEVNILTPEFGPRLYLTGILTELELEPDRRMEEQVCIGESCSRCVHSCPPDAVRQWGLDKAACATEAQEFGYAQITKFFDKYFNMGNEERKAAIRSRDLFGFWQGLLRVVGSFGDCPRCLAVCPVGNDYHAHLADIQKRIPEKTPEKAAKAAAFKQARKEGRELPGLSDWNIRWVGEKGYQGIVARQLQEFKKRQRESQ